MSKLKRPRDTNQLAKSIVDLTTGDAEEVNPDEGKDPAAFTLGRKGGLKGGKARAANMTKEERSEAARRRQQKLGGTRNNPLFYIHSEIIPSPI